MPCGRRAFQMGAWLAFNAFSALDDLSAKSARYAVLTVHAGTQRCIGHAESLREGESQCLRLLRCLCLTLRTRMRASPGRFWILRRTAMLRCSWGCRTRTASSNTSRSEERREGHEGEARG